MKNKPKEPPAAIKKLLLDGRYSKYVTCRVFVHHKGKRFSLQEHHVNWYVAYREWPASFLDHIDGNPINNDVKNLRLASQSQNCANSKRRYNSLTGKKGVNRQPNGSYQARICVRGRSIYLGIFKTLDEAASAYDKAAVEHFGEFARVNG